LLAVRPRRFNPRGKKLLLHQGLSCFRFAQHCSNLPCAKFVIGFLSSLAMPVLISMLRGINVGGHNKVKMDALRALYVSLNLENPQTYIQSGNVIFKTNQRDFAQLAEHIQQSIENKFACCPEIILRTADDLRSVIKKNPFLKRPDIDPAKLLIAFLAHVPGDQARETLRKQKFAPEELHVADRELYIYFPNGIGQSKLSWPRIHKLLGTFSTGRNWISVCKILQIAESLEAS
jgi:uncharacterized protein (DUF1697 family)